MRRRTGGPAGTGLLHTTRYSASSRPCYATASSAVSDPGLRDGRAGLHQPDRGAGLPASHRSYDAFASHDINLGPGLKWGLGLLLNTADAPGMRRAGSGAWAGLCNTHFWVDRATGSARRFTPTRCRSYRRPHWIPTPASSRRSTSVAVTGDLDRPAPQPRFRGPATAPRWSGRVGPRGIQPEKQPRTQKIGGDPVSDGRTWGYLVRLLASPTVVQAGIPRMRPTARSGFPRPVSELGAHLPRCASL